MISIWAKKIWEAQIISWHMDRTNNDPLRRQHIRWKEEALKLGLLQGATKNFVAPQVHGLACPCTYCKKGEALNYMLRLKGCIIIKECHTRKSTHRNRYTIWWWIGSSCRCCSNLCLLLPSLPLSCKKTRSIVTTNACKCVTKYHIAQHKSMNPDR